MNTPLRVLISIVLPLCALQAIAQQEPSTPKTIPDSINYMWKMVESDFTSLAEAMPEEKWSFKPTQGAFTDVRTFGEQVKHVACANEAWAKEIARGVTARPLRHGRAEPSKDENRDSGLSARNIRHDGRRDREEQARQFDGSDKRSVRRRQSA